MRRRKVNKLLKQNSGVTLIETVLAVALIALVVSLGYTFFFTGFRAFDRNVERVDIQQNVRHSLSFVSKKLFNESDANVIVTTIPGAADELRIGRYFFRLVGTTLFVNQDWPNAHSPFNPLAEEITGFDVSREGRMITVMITAGEFDLSAQVLLRR